jgi:hypothetical protein
MNIIDPPSKIRERLGIEAFRASFMIVASLGPYLAISGRDHGTV